MDVKHINATRKEKWPDHTIQGVPVIKTTTTTEATSNKTPRSS